MEDVGFVNINVHRVIAAQSLFINIVLNRIDIMVNKQFTALQITGEAAHPVIHSDDVGIKTANQIIQRGKRGNFAACGHVDVHPKGGQAGFRVIFRVSVHRDVAFVQMGHGGVAHRQHRTFSNQQSDAGPLRVIILAGNVQHLGANHFGHVGQDAC